MHTGRKCSVLERSRGATRAQIIDKKLVLQNATRKQKAPSDKSQLPRPVAPREPGEILTICSSLAEIRNHRLADLDDIKISEYEYITSHFVSERNAYRVLNCNASLRIRVLEVDFDYLLPWQRTVRFALKAHRHQNGKQTAARMVLDFVCDDMEQFRIARDHFFIAHRDEKGELHFVPRYKKGLIVGDFTDVNLLTCRRHIGCSKKCEMSYTHCVGRQTATLHNALGQINVLESDRIDYSIYNGWWNQWE